MDLSRDGHFFLSFLVLCLNVWLLSLLGGRSRSVGLPDCYTMATFRVSDWNAIVVQKGTGMRYSQ